jgi:hypothetical protein
LCVLEVGIADLAAIARVIFDVAHPVARGLRTLAMAPFTPTTENAVDSIVVYWASLSFLDGCVILEAGFAALVVWCLDVAGSFAETVAHGH